MKISSLSRVEHFYEVKRERSRDEKLEKLFSAPGELFFLLKIDFPHHWKWKSFLNSFPQRKFRDEKNFLTFRFCFSAFLKSKRQRIFKRKKNFQLKLSKNQQRNGEWLANFHLRPKAFERLRREKFLSENPKSF